MTKKLLITGSLIYSILLHAAPACAASGDFTIYPSYTHSGSKSWIIREAAPGSTATEYLTLENLSGENQEVQVNIKEAYAEKGKFITLENDSFENIGNWIGSPQNSYLLSPHEKIKIPVRMDIPEDAATGQYTAAVFAAQKKAVPGENLNIVTQIGTRIYLNVTHEGPGLASVIDAPEYKTSFFFILSLAGLLGSVAYYLINHHETGKA